MADVAGIYIDTIVNFASSVSEPPKVAAALIGNSGSLVAAAQGFLMQAWDSVTNQQYDWLVESPDFTGAYYPGPNSPLNIALAAVIIQC